MASTPRILVYFLRKDLRLADNPVLHDIARAGAASLTQSYTGWSEKGLATGAARATLPAFTHLLPIYVFPAQQVEVSGFCPPDKGSSNPYPPARSATGGYWRCGPHRARFLADSVHDTRQAFRRLGSDLVIRVGSMSDTLRQVLSWFQQTSQGEVVGVCLTKDVGTEENEHEDAVKRVADDHGINVHWWTDEKYLINTEDLPFDHLSDLPNVFTSFRKSVEPLREKPRPVLPEPASLPSLPAIPPQEGPFEIPDTVEELTAGLLRPLDEALGLAHPPTDVEASASAHPFRGGSASGMERLTHLLTSEAMTRYAETRNGLLGVDYSTKLSAFLALGCITARQVHWAMYDFEQGRSDVGREADGFGAGESKGTAGVRFELLWRDYMRLVAFKVGKNLFTVNGFPKSAKADPAAARARWSYLEADQRFDAAVPAVPAGVAQRLGRFLQGTTGTSFVDAAQRELFQTGYVSNRARQNVASYLAKHLKIDWRLGAEWYEMLLVDYDVASNWGNWQYVAGVGNDPRVERIFNPVKQALDYDPDGAYIQTWIPPLRDITLDGQRETSLMGIYQPWTLPDDQKDQLKLRGYEWVDDPLLRINFDINPKGKSSRGRGRGRGRGGRRGERSWRRRGEMERGGEGSNPTSA